MPKIQNGEVNRAILATRQLIEYAHPVTRAGLQFPMQIRLMRLEKLLRERAMELQQLKDEMVKRYGWKGKPDRDSEFYPAYREEENKLALEETDVPDELMISLAQLKVRDENQELADIECPMVVYLGPLLSIDAPVAPAGAPRARAARSGKAKGRRARG